MFGSNVLEVGIGLVFTFLAISLITGAIVEAISSWLGLRASTLLRGVKDLLNDPGFTGLAAELYAHAAINPRGPGTAAPAVKLPAYIDKEQFAAAVMDIMDMSRAIAAAASTPSATTPQPALVAALTGAVDAKIGPAGAALPANPQLQQLLDGMIHRARGDADEIKRELATWFDNGMDRVGGVYKRYTQVFSVAIALVLAVVLNINSITIAKALWVQPTLVANIKAANAAPSAEEVLTMVDKTLPAGWPAGYFKKLAKDAGGKDVVVCYGFPWDWLVAIAGWLITAIAVLFGAPFWFDALQRITRLKGSGPSPAEKKDQTAAAQ